MLPLPEMDAIDPVFGSSRYEAWKGYSVKGNLVSARRRYVREKWGDKGSSDVLGRLEGHAKRVFEAEILPFAWLGFDILTDIDRAIIGGPMGGDVSLMKQFGNEVARNDLSTIYKMLLKLGSPSFIAKRTSVVYGTYVRGGSMMASDVGPRHSRTVLSEGCLPLYFCTYGIPGWFSAALELSGAKEVQVSESACVHRGAKHCEWAASWG